MKKIASVFALFGFTFCFLQPNAQKVKILVAYAFLKLMLTAVNNWVKR